MTTKRKYAGCYRVEHNGEVYQIESVDYGSGTEWNLLLVEKSELFGERLEWGNTYPTLKDAKSAIEND